MASDVRGKPKKCAVVEKEVALNNSEGPVQGQLWFLLLFALHLLFLIVQADKSRHWDFCPPLGRGPRAIKSNKLSAYHSWHCHLFTLLFLVVIFSDFGDAACSFYLDVYASLPASCRGLPSSLPSESFSALVYLLMVLEVPFFHTLTCLLSDSAPDHAFCCDSEFVWLLFIWCKYIVPHQVSPSYCDLGTVSVTSQNLCLPVPPHNCRDETEFITTEVTLTWEFCSNYLAFRWHFPFILNVFSPSPHSVSLSFSPWPPPPCHVLVELTHFIPIPLLASLIGRPLVLMLGIV